MNHSRRRFLLRGLAIGPSLTLPGLITGCDRNEARSTGSSCRPFGTVTSGAPAVFSEDLPTLAQMERHTDTLLDSPEVEVRLLGRSRAGRPIRLISLGDGPGSALVIGAPHPNEPVGCATIERFIDLLLHEPGLRERLGYRWHFIKAIDPDGVALNEAWFSGTRTPERYLDSFYRPAFRLQPEYSFPLHVPGYRFDAPTPENLCWQQALELTRPQLQCSLHNADLGGAFFLVSRDIPELTRALAKLPAAVSVSLNSAGEPFAEIAPIAPGVFTFPDLRALVQQVVERELPVEDYWNAGDSSAHFAAERYGTFSMTCEVPLWDAGTGASDFATACSGRDLIEHQLHAGEETLSILSKHLPYLEPMLRTDDERLLFEALADSARMTTALQPRLRRLLRVKRLQGFAPLALQRWLGLPESNLEPLPCPIHAIVDSTMTLANPRAFAMLRRLFDLVEAHTPDPRIADGRHQAAAYIAQQLAELQRDAPLRPLPLGALTALQTAAILESAGCLGNESG